ncbi:large exoprotein [Microbacterium oryzae]|uniref:large exoprotein n=1 Tax=Microbacterium oryzae TaxID=743009 RepID=UPI0025B11AC3|nr:large exoprotein [Microbacterium oryzae]MDN3311022.1 large exoprotein [Microbacterium oryzae]
MGGQMLGGGVIIAVAVLLWIVYLLPTWHSRMRYNAAERNAVRLSQALRVLAETSETPAEIHVELSAREARAQERLVQRMRAEEERLRAEQNRIALERKRLEVQADVDRSREEAALELERRRAELAAEADRRRRALEAARRDPAVRRARQARARRALRLTATGLLMASFAAIAYGATALAQGGAGWWLAGGAVTALVAIQALARMAAVARRTRRPAAQTVARAPEAAPVAMSVPVHRTAPVLLDAEDRGWTPRTLPAPLASVSGSRAAVVLAEARAQEALRAAAREEGLRAQAAAAAPVSIATARPAAERSRYAGMGVVDDAEIEAHVRQLLARRAAS